MNKDVVINIVTMVLSDMNFMMIMLIIAMISVCFLGRYVVISRKMIIATLGVLALQLIYLFTADYILAFFFPEAVEYINNMSTTDTVGLNDPDTANYYVAVLFMNIFLNAMVFVYAFVFYLIIHKEHRFLRAVESTICLYLFYSYVNNTIRYAYVFFRCGSFDVLEVVTTELGGKEVGRFNALLIITVSAISIILLVILYFGYYKKKRYYVLKIRDRVLFIVWLILFFTIPSVPFYSEDVSGQYELLSFVFAIIIILLGILAPVLLVMLVSGRSMKEKNEYQENYLTAELEYIEQYKRTQTETRAFRHDIINNLSLTSMMLEEGNVDGAGEHLKELLGSVKALSPSIITGDEMLDCIVSMKADKMRELGMDFSLDGVIDGGLHMKPMDVCSIFANALDNAIEAASQVTEPWVNMKIKRTEKFFIIKIANSAVQKVDVEKLFMTAGYTSKKDKEHHGFGLRNIAGTVEEYDGLLKAESEDNSFALSIMIPR